MTAEQLEVNGVYFQTGDGRPVTAKRILKALCKGGEVKGEIQKGCAFLSCGDKLLGGEIKAKKEYYSTFNELMLMNPDAIMQNSYGQLRFLYSI